MLIIFGRCATPIIAALAPGSRIVPAKAALVPAA